MKAIFGVLFGYALMFIIVGTALADPGASASATSNTSTQLTAEENSRPSLDAVRDRAKQASHKSLAKLERRLSQLANDIDVQANLKGETFIANRVAPEFGMTGTGMTAEQASLNARLGDLVIAHTLAANSVTPVTMRQLFQLQHEGYGWARIAYGLDLRSDQVAGAVESEARVASGKLKADGKPAMIQSGANAAASAGKGMGTSAGTSASVNAGGAGVGAGGSAGVGLNVGK